jgi:ubiquitin-activating enzyme E1
LSKYKAVVLTDHPLSEQLRINEYTHKNKIAFVSVCTHGLFGSIFCDFGEEFAVVDPTGENPVSGILAGIDDSGLVTALDESRHGLEDGDYVTFNEVQGMDSINGAEFKVEVKGMAFFLTPMASG